MMKPSRLSLSLPALVSLIALGTGVACQSSSTQYPPQPYGYPPGYGAPGQPPAGPQQPGQPYPGQPQGQPQPGQPWQPQPGPPPGQPGQPPATTPPGATPMPGGNAILDPINNVDMGWLRARAQAVHQELVQALPANARARVTGIPLLFDDEPGSVNAFAACTQSGKSVVALTDGLIDISAHLAQARATDELFGSNKTDEYIQFVARNQRPKQPIVRPPLTFFDPRQKLDARKVSRQAELYDEAVGFVLAHELAHHHLGHLPCTAGNVTASEIGVVLTDAVPAFNQINESGADTAGVHNLLSAGARRSGYRYNEGGALLVLRFFGGVDASSPVDIFEFERTHPPPSVRVPIVQQTANTFRFTGGAPLPWVN